MCSPKTWVCKVQTRNYSDAEKISPKNQNPTVYIDLSVLDYLFSFTKLYYQNEEMIHMHWNNSEVLFLHINVYDSQRMLLFQSSITLIFPS